MVNKESDIFYICFDLVAIFLYLVINFILGKNIIKSQN